MRPQYRNHRARTVAMRSHHILFTVAAVFLAAAHSGCGENAVEPEETEDFENFDRTQFDAGSANITNRWLALQPGTRLIYDGFSVEGDTDVPRHVELNVTDLTKVIDGVRARVIYTLDYSDGALVEAELGFLAQDKTGTVWRMGEYPEEYEAAQLVDAPTWIHGIEDAVAGISMLANPSVGANYSLGWGPGVDAMDRGTVDGTGVRTCVPDSVCYNDVLLIAESAPDDDGVQLRYFARDVGNIRIAWRGPGAKAREKLDLTEIKQLTSVEMQAVCQAASGLEACAYQNSNDVYALTAPLEPATCP